VAWWSRRFRTFVAEAMMAWHWEAELHWRTLASATRAKLVLVDAERRSCTLRRDPDGEVWGLDRTAKLRAEVERHLLRAVEHKEKRERWRRSVRD
jgi:hypothetical protein